MLLVVNKVQKSELDELVVQWNLAYRLGVLDSFAVTVVDIDKPDAVAAAHITQLQLAQFSQACSGVEAEQW